MLLLTENATVKCNSVKYECNLNENSVYLNSIDYPQVRCFIVLEQKRTQQTNIDTNKIRIFNICEKKGQQQNNFFIAIRPKYFFMVVMVSKISGQAITLVFSIVTISRPTLNF